MKSRLFDLMSLEKRRQESTINLIASENYASNNVLQAAGSVLTNKYAEGYAGRRYYGGCQVIDEVETYTIELGKKLFKTEHLNVQPHSGSNANFAAYLGLVNPGDTILAMSLSAGGHLTHGHHINFSGKIYKFVHYGVDPKTEQLDYAQIEQLAREHKPKLIVAGASAYARLIDYEKLAAIARAVGAPLMVDMAHIAGLVAADVIASPVPWSDVVTTTTHKTLRGPRGGLILSKAALGATIDKAVMPGSQGGPLMHIIAAKGVAFEEALQPSFKTYAQQIINNAKAMAKTFAELGYRLVAGGTDTHLFLIDLRSIKNHEPLTGREVEDVLSQCNIIVNRNSIPFDTQSPMITSGIRIGTPAITTRGLTELQSQQIAHWIDEAIRNRHNTATLTNIKKEVARLCTYFPVYDTYIPPMELR